MHIVYKRMNMTKKASKNVVLRVFLSADYDDRLDAVLFVPMVEREGTPNGYGRVCSPWKRYASADYEIAERNGRRLADRLGVEFMPYP